MEWYVINRDSFNLGYLNLISYCVDTCFIHYADIKIGLPSSGFFFSAAEQTPFYYLLF